MTSIPPNSSAPGNAECTCTWTRGGDIRIVSGCPIHDVCMCYELTVTERPCPWCAACNALHAAARRKP